jgi:hypothetical protein
LEVMLHNGYSSLCVSYSASVRLPA